MLLMRRLGMTAVSAIVLALVLGMGLAVEASARNYAMSGNWLMRRGQVAIPLRLCLPSDVPYGAPTPGGAGHQGTCGFGFPASLPNQGAIGGGGQVAVTGSNPAQITVPAGAFAGSFGATLPLQGTSLVQISSTFTGAGPAGNQVLQKNHWSVAATRAAANFTWCPGDPACVAQAPQPGGLAPCVAGGPCTDPPQGAGTRNGRIVYVAGTNAFGGTMQMVLGNGGTLSLTFNAPTINQPMQVLHDAFGGGGGTQAFGGAYSFHDNDTLPAGPVTQPLIRPTPNGTIVAPGPRLTTGGAWTTCNGQPTPANLGTNLTNCVVGVGPIQLGLPQLNLNTGFPHTTGTVIAQQTTGTAAGRDFLTFQGTDQRTALGAGNIQLVSGGLTLRTPVNVTFASGEKVTMTLSSPVPSMSPKGIAAGALLMVLAVGYAMRRRF